jgi:ubiquitin carboxyl-terminal hydrolase 16/45
MNSVVQGLIATDLLEELVLFRSPSQPYVQPSASRRSPLVVNGRGPEDIQQEWVQGMAIGDAFLHTLERAWRMRDARDRSNMNPK